MPNIAKGQNPVRGITKVPLDQKWKQRLTLAPSRGGKQATASILISGVTIVAHLGHQLGIQLNRSYQEDILTIEIVVATEKTGEEEEDQGNQGSKG